MTIFGSELPVSLVHLIFLLWQFRVIHRRQKSINAYVSYQAFLLFSQDYSMAPKDDDFQSRLIQVYD